MFDVCASMDSCIEYTCAHGTQVNDKEGKSKKTDSNENDGSDVADEKVNEKVTDKSGVDNSSE